MQEGGAFRSITNKILDGYLGKTGNDWVASLSASRSKALADAKVTTDVIWQKINEAQAKAAKANMSPFLGTYTDQWFGAATISDAGDKYRFDSKRSPRLTGQILPYKGNAFVVKWDDRSMDADAFLTFTTDEDGKATGFTMKAISPLTDFSFDFHDLDFRRVK